MKNKNLVFVLTIAVVSLFGLVGTAQAGVPVVMDAAFSNPNQITITYNEPVNTVAGDYTNIIVSSTQCGPFSPNVVSVSGSPGTVIDLSLDMGCDTGQTATMDIAGVTSVSTGDPIVPIVGQVVDDGQAPTVGICCNNGAGANPDTMWVFFGENVNGFTMSDIGPVNNGSVTGFAEVIPTWLYQIQITAVAEGTVTVDIPAGIASDAMGYLNTAATQFSYIYDAMLPTLVSAQITGPNTVTVTYSESVYGDGSEYENFGGDLAGRNAITSPPQPCIVCEIVLDGPPMATSATGTMDIQNNAGIQDLAWNWLDDSLTLGVNVTDGQAPTVVITSTESFPTTTTPIPFTATFSEDVSTLDISEIGVSFPGSVTSFTPITGSVYDFEITPYNEGGGSVSIIGGAVADSSGNPNAGNSTTLILYDDGAPPTIVSAGVFSDTKLHINMSEPVAIVGSPNWATDVTATGLTVIDGIVEPGTNLLQITILPISNTAFTAPDLFMAPGLLEDTVGGDLNPPQPPITVNDWQLPTVTPLGNGTSTYTIPAGGTADLIFSEPLSATGKSAVETAVSTGASQTISYSWDGTDSILTINGHPTSATVFVNDVNTGMEDANGNPSINSANWVAPGPLLINSTGDSVPPVITVNPPNPASVDQNQTYSDAGATALDAVDGPVAVNTTNPVNTSVAGTYTVTYTASDAAGNGAIATRTVTVNSPPPPGGCCVFYSSDTNPPTNTSIIINSGAASTSALGVTLALSATDASHMAISNDPNFTGAGLENYSTAKTWTLAAGAAGARTVYAKFRDSAGNYSAAISDTITLSTAGEVLGAATGEVLGASTFKFTKLLKMLSRGNEVKELQKRLSATALYSAKIDGIFGKITKKAVTKFQKKNKLVADGIVGPKTRAALNKTNQ